MTIIPKISSGKFVILMSTIFLLCLILSAGITTQALLAQTAPDGSIYSEGFLEKQYDVSQSDLSKALDTIFFNNKCLPGAIRLLAGNAGKIETWGIGDKNGKFIAETGAKWSGVGTIKELDIKEGGVLIAVKTVTGDKTMNIGFKVGDGDRKSSGILHKMLADKLQKNR